MQWLVNTSTNSRMAHCYQNKGLLDSVAISLCGLTINDEDMQGIDHAMTYCRTCTRQLKIIQEKQ